MSTSGPAERGSLALWDRLPEPTDVDRLDPISIEYVTLAIHCRRLELSPSGGESQHGRWHRAAHAIRARAGNGGLAACRYFHRESSLRWNSQTGSMVACLQSANQCGGRIPIRCAL